MMGRYRVVIIGFLAYLGIGMLPVLAQSRMTAKVIDAVTKEPIPYVNIGFLNKGIGTVSDETGFFTLPLDKSIHSESDLVEISCIGYAKLVLPFANLLRDRKTIYELKPSPIELDEIVLSAKESNVRAFKEGKKVTIGYSYVSSGTVGYWKDQIALGGELVRLSILTKKFAN